MREKILFSCTFQKLALILQPHLGKTNEVGTLPEWLGTGLQNRGQRFESARYLRERAVKMTTLSYLRFGYLQFGYLFLDLDI